MKFKLKSSLDNRIIVENGNSNSFNMIFAVTSDLMIEQCWCLPTTTKSKQGRLIAKVNPRVLHLISDY